eukprot:CAMPEP_0119559688 /NCGR_PEP_ID=MMETSP1352-20130426/13080_1 /TAXON_ID=265584 /ORGANISM="Stauroneis constricta, Strain CCMP1120" /LENGTH=134 /DNA_ID=CAMNT_0007607451 /DNA_START=71 /DNA_END=478 /DNA_ORIENTATION=-
MSEDPKKPTFDVNEILKTIRSGIKTTVATANGALSNLQDATENTRKPIESTWKTVESHSKQAGEQIINTYNKRKEHPNEIIGGSTVAGALLMGARRGRFGALFGGAVAGGLAYAAVYDKFDLEEVPDVIFGRKK